MTLISVSYTHLDVYKRQGGETWEYEYTRSESKGVNSVPIASAFYAGTNDYKKKLKIKFNSANVAERHAFSSSTGETRHGMFQ